MTRFLGASVGGALAIGDGGTGLIALGSALQVLRVNAGGTALEYATAGGDVGGPASSTDNAITRFDGVTGKMIQNSVATLDDSGNFVTVGYYQFGDGSLSAPALRFSGASADTGIYSPGTDQIAFSQNGVQTLRMSAAGSLTLTGDASSTQSIINLMSGSNTAGSLVRFANVNIGSQTGNLAFLQWERDSNQGRRLSAFVSTNAGVSTQAMLLDYTGAATFNAISVASLTSSGAVAGTTITGSGLGSFSGITATGGTAANFTIWQNSNVLRNRGGTSGWAVDNTSAVQTLGVNNTGQVQVGPTTGNITHQVYGRLRVANASTGLAAIIGEIEYDNTTVSIAPGGPATFTVPTGQTGLAFLVDADNGGSAVYRFDVSNTISLISGANINGNISLTKSGSNFNIASASGTRNVKLDFLYF